MKALLRNLRFSLRMLHKNSGLTVAVLATMALGIGATTAIYTVVYQTLIAPLPYAEPDQLVMVWSEPGDGRNVISAGDFLDWKQQNKSFQDIVASTGASFNLSTRDQPEQVDGRRATPGFFKLFGIPLFLGRDFLPEEGIPGRDHEVILTYKQWNRLGADRSIIGKTLQIDGAPYTVVGVTPPGVWDNYGSELTVPLAFRPEQINHDYHWMIAMARLKPGVTIAQAQADMDSVTARIAAAYPKSNKGWGASVEPLKDDFVPPERIRNLWLLLGAVGFVLLITCVNIANLLLAKGASRQREVAIRGSMGATRRQIFGQILTESLVLAVLGGGLGVLLGAALLRGINMVLPENSLLPAEVSLSLDLPVLLAALAATTLAGLLFGYAPAWYASRIDPAEALKEGGRSGASAGSQNLRRTLVVGEFALALALLAGAGLTIHSFWNLTRVDLGLRTDHVLTFGLNQPSGKLAIGEEMDSYYRQILAAVKSTPGAAHAAVVTGMPLQYHSDGMGFTVVGEQKYTEPSQRPDAGFDGVTPDYFKTFGVQIVRGREFNEQDTATSVRVAIVNEELARHYLKGTDPLKQRLSIDQLIPGAEKLGPPVEWQIVGVSHNVRYDFRQDSPQIIVPFTQSPMPSVNIGVRTVEDPAAMTRTIAAAVHSVDAQIALATPRTLDEVKDHVLAGDRFTMALFGSFAGLAILLAAIGIYGVMAFAVSQRTREIGVRIALGASKGNISSLIVREGSILALVGLVVGLGGALFVGRAMQSTLYGVKALDLTVFGMVAGILFAIALLASYLPARRAAAIDPVTALRSE
jgi:putative ABC transport system permease protein